MVSSISSSTATQATYAPAARKTPDETVATPGPVATTDDQDRAAAPTQSAESAASARLGEQLNAQADASRVQRMMRHGRVLHGIRPPSSTARIDALHLCGCMHALCSEGIHKSTLA
jgi:hypothetical protein